MILKEKAATWSRILHHLWKGYNSLYLFKYHLLKSLTLLDNIFVVEFLLVRFVRPTPSFPNLVAKEVDADLVE